MEPALNARALRQSTVLVRLLNGRRAGEEVEMPYHAAEDALRARTVERVQPAEQPEQQGHLIRGRVTKPQR